MLRECPRAPSCIPPSSPSLGEPLRSRGHCSLLAASACCLLRPRHGLKSLLAGASVVGRIQFVVSYSHFRVAAASTRAALCLLCSPGSHGARRARHADPFIMPTDGETFLFTSESVGEGHPGTSWSTRMGRSTPVLRCGFNQQHLTLTYLLAPPRPLRPQTRSATRCRTPSSMPSSLWIRWPGLPAVSHHPHHPHPPADSG